MTTTPRPSQQHRIEQLRDVCGQLSDTVVALTNAEQDAARQALLERVAGYRARLAALGVTEDAVDKIPASNPGYYLDAALYAEVMASRLLAATEEDIPTARQFRAHVGEHTEGQVRIGTLQNALEPRNAPGSSLAVISRYQRMVGALTTTAIALAALDVVRGALPVRSHDE